MRNASILMNPVAGPQSLEKKEEIIEKAILFLANLGIHANSFGLNTKTSEEFRGLARDLSYSHSPLIISGGDGTLLQVLNSDINPNVVLGYLPTGTGNALQKTLGIKNIRNALEKIVMGRTFLHDLILYNGDLKCFYAGTGFDSEFISQLEEIKEKRGRKGWPLHIGSFLRSYANYNAPQLEIETDSQTTVVENNFATFVGTTPYLGRGLSVHNGAYPYNGQLAVSTYNSLFQLLSSVISNGRSANTSKCKRVITRSEMPQHYQCNGELTGPTQEAEFRILPNAIRLII